MRSDDREETEKMYVKNYAIGFTFSIYIGYRESYANRGDGSHYERHSCSTARDEAEPIKFTRSKQSTRRTSPIMPKWPYERSWLLLSMRVDYHLTRFALYLYAPAHTHLSCVLYYALHILDKCKVNASLYTCVPRSVQTINFAGEIIHCTMCKKHIASFIYTATVIK